MHPLDNPVWEALGSRHASFALGSARARRYAPEVGPFCAVSDPRDPGCWDALAMLVPSTAVARAWTWALPDFGSRLRLRDANPVLQLVQERAPAIVTTHSVEAVRLGPRDAEDMLRLARLAAPGPFQRRTVELGDYLGVRDRAGRLVAMAGERVRVAGWTEISAVCTHPDHRGRGLAGWLVMRLATMIRRRGESPFMHVRGSNTTAQRLYAKLGFVERRRGYSVALERAAA